MTTQSLTWVHTNCLEKLWIPLLGTVTIHGFSGSRVPHSVNYVCPFPEAVANSELQLPGLSAAHWKSCHLCPSKSGSRSGKPFSWPQQAEQHGFLSFAPLPDWQLPYTHTNTPQLWLSTAAVNVNTEEGSYAWCAVILWWWCYVRNVP